MRGEPPPVVESSNSAPAPDLETTLIDLAVESWRFSRLFRRAVLKLDAGEAPRYESQLRYFLKRVEAGLAMADLKLVDVEGQLYEPGIAASALNVEDFAAEDRLIVEQMLEPIIMGADGLRRSGVVMLRKVEL
jgi:hypothetical protein